MHLVGFEPAIPVKEWTQTCALDNTVTEIGHVDFFQVYSTAESRSRPVYNRAVGQFTTLTKVDIWQR
jgi:hypothetical protein